MVIASPFTRTQQTTRIIANNIGKRVFTDQRLQEQPNSATTNDAMSLIKSTIQDIQTSVLKNYIVVTHGHWLSLMIKNLFPEYLFQGITQLKRPHIVKMTLTPKGNKLSM